jgi:L-ascorbate 6-phosphate lactonase
MTQDTIHATWGDWLTAEIAQAEPDGVAVWYLGCNGFVLKSPTTTLYVDSYFGDGDLPKLIRMIHLKMIVRLKKK